MPGTHPSGRVTTRLRDPDRWTRDDCAVWTDGRPTPGVRLPVAATPGQGPLRSRPRATQLCATPRPTCRPDGCAGPTTRDRVARDAGHAGPGLARLPRAPRTARCKRVRSWFLEFPTSRCERTPVGGNWEPRAPGSRGVSYSLLSGAHCDPVWTPSLCSPPVPRLRPRLGCEGAPVGVGALRAWSPEGRPGAGGAGLALLL